MSDFRVMLAGSPYFNGSENFFPNINLQDGLNWAEAFIQSVVLPRLPEAVASHFPVALGTVLVMFACAGIFRRGGAITPVSVSTCRTKSLRPFFRTEQVPCVLARGAPFKR